MFSIPPPFFPQEAEARGATPSEVKILNTFYKQTNKQINKYLLVWFCLWNYASWCIHLCSPDCYIWEHAVGPQSLVCFGWLFAIHVWSPFWFHCVNSQQTHLSQSVLFAQVIMEFKGKVTSMKKHCIGSKYIVLLHLKI